MIKTKYIIFISILLIATYTHAQFDDDAKIDSISIKMVNFFQNENPEVIDYHIVRIEDLSYIIDLVKDTLDKELLKKIESEMDSVPIQERRSWYNKCKYTREDGKNEGIEWQKIKYMSSDIEYKNDEKTGMKIALIKANFEYKDIAYYLYYDCVKTNRGWVFGGKLHLDKPDNRDE